MKYLLILLMTAIIWVYSAGLVNAQSNQIGPTTPTRGEISWLWLIPVIGIPLLLYGLTQTQRQDEDTPISREDKFAGSKGGEAARKRRQNDMSSNTPEIREKD